MGLAATNSMVGCRDQGLGRRPVGIDQLQRRGDGRLFLVGGGLRRRRRGVPRHQHLTGDVVHFGPNLGQRLLGGDLDLGAAQGAVEGKGQLGVIEVGAQAPFAGRLRNQDPVDPGLMLGDGDLGHAGGGAQLGLPLGVQGAGLGEQEVHEALQPGVLTRDGLRMDLRGPRRGEAFAHLGQQARKAAHPRGRRGQPLRQGGEVPGDQPIEGRAYRGLVDQRVPPLGLQGVVGPDLAGQAVAQDGGVHLPLAAELGRHDGGQACEKGRGAVAAGGPARQAQIVQPVVIAVIPPERGGDRAEPQIGLQPGGRQGVEG